MSSQVQASKPRPYQLDIPRSEVERAVQLAKLTDLKPYLECCTSDYKDLEAKLSDYDFANLYGIKPSKLISLVDRLATGKFDWFQWQDRLNAMGQHGMVTVTGIEDEASLDVHYVSVKSEAGEGAPTVVLVHG